MTFIGAMQVSANGDVANWNVPGKRLIVHNIYLYIIQTIFQGHWWSNGFGQFKY